MRCLYDTLLIHPLQMVREAAKVYLLDLLRQEAYESAEQFNNALQDVQETIQGTDDLPSDAAHPRQPDSKVTSALMRS